MTETLVLTTDMLIVLAILALTIFLFITEKFRVDIVALLAMVLVGLFELVPAQDLFDGFASNAVIAIIAIMVIGAGLDKSGIMYRVAHFLVKMGGRTEKGILPIILSTTALLSSFMQNIGVTALFLPVLTRISSRTHIPLSRLLMPMGFSALLGGTLTLVGCSSLILLNDLILVANETLPIEVAPMTPFGLFDTTPIGLVLVATGIFYFLGVGRWILPTLKTQSTEPITPVNYFRQRYRLPTGDIFELLVTPNSPLVGATLLAYERQVGSRAVIVALLKGKHLRISPARDVVLEPGDSFAMMGELADIQAFAQRFHLMLKPHIGVFTEILLSIRSGISEVVIPPGSRITGKSLLNMRMRKTYGLSVLQVLRHNHTIREELRDLVLQEGDTLLVHSTWEDLAALQDNKNFVTLTAHTLEESQRPDKILYALFFFALAIGLALFSELRLGLALLVGALGMLLFKVISIDESYKRISWQTIFLLAGLIPLGKAAQTTGTAAWIAQKALYLLGDVPHWILLTVLALLATFFTQIMSNVGTTVLLVPLAVSIAVQTGADPSVFALTVALATSNSFILPTHQVNALVMGPGNYQVIDYIRAGGGMTILFLIVLVTMMSLIF